MTDMPEEERKDWLDLGAGLGLLLMGPDDEDPSQVASELIMSMRTLEETGDAEDLDHWTAVALAVLRDREQMPEFARERWSRLDSDFHLKYCKTCKQPWR